MHQAHSRCPVVDDSLGLGGNILEGGNRQIDLGDDIVDETAARGAAGGRIERNDPLDQEIQVCVLEADAAQLGLLRCRKSGRAQAIDDRRQFRTV